jgi:hypothetical protein
VPALYAFAAVSFGASVWMTFEAPSQAFYLPVYRAWELLIGAIIAVDGIPKLSARIARIAPLVGLGAILIAGAAFSSSTPFPGLAALLPGLGAGLVILAGGENAPALLRSKPLVLLGLVSYPLYLWHWPVLVFARYALLRAPTPNETAALVLLSFALAWATWRAVEIPLRRWVDKRLQQRIVIFSVAAVVLAFAGAAGAGAYLTHGFPSREPVTIAVLRPMGQSWGGARHKHYVPCSIVLFAPGSKPGRVSGSDVLWGQPQCSSLGGQFFSPPVPRTFRSGRGLSASDCTGVVGLLPAHIRSGG